MSADTERPCVECGIETGSGARRFGEFALCEECLAEMGRKERKAAFKAARLKAAEAALPDDPEFEDYLEPYGEYGLPIYTALPLDHKIHRRVVERRAAYLESTYDLSENQALALAMSETGGGSGAGDANHLDVTTNTLKRYREQIADTFGEWVLVRDPIHDLEADLLDKPEGWVPRECPNCEKDRVCSVEEARRVFGLKADKFDRIEESTTHVCSYCGLPLEA